jgi:hypothetical protein
MDFILNYRNKIMNEMKNTHFNILKINDLPGYPLYPPNEDIYKRASKVEDVDFEDIPKSGSPSKWNEKTFDEDESGDDLDVPGSEQDDEQEAIGNEDEENNYYSLGGDDHNDLEENQGRD